VASHKSAEKRMRQSERRRARNKTVRSNARTAVKRFRTAAESGDPDAARAQLHATEHVVRKAAAKGVIPKRRASRIVSRLARRLDALSS
jgi:small subunit ribosomal protein S20